MTAPATSTPDGTAPTTTGLLLMAHGTPARPEDLLAFTTEVRRGHPPSPELLDELRARYDAIGGLSPLAAISDAQRGGVQAALDRRAPGRWVTALGCKFAAPRIPEAVDRLVAAGCDQVVGVVLAPHSSTVSVGDYRRRAVDAAAGRIPVHVVDRWHLHPGLVTLLADRVRAAVAGVPSDRRARVVVLCTAHSVPVRVVDAGDDYPDQVAQTAEAVLSASGTDGSTAFQSAGRTAEPWVGPDVLDAIRQAAADGATAVVVCPVGFVSDHLEVLYDLDIEARSVAEQAGLWFARTASCNDDPVFCDVVADVALDAASRLDREPVHP